MDERVLYDAIADTLLVWLISTPISIVAWMMWECLMCAAEEEA